MRISPHALTRVFAPNLGATHIQPLAPDLRPIEEIRPVRLGEGPRHIRICENPDCLMEFATNKSRQRYCTDDCRNVSAVRRHRRNTTVAQRRERERERNQAWACWRALDSHNTDGDFIPPPPRIIGRPDRMKREDWEEWRRLHAIRERSLHEAIKREKEGG